MIRAKFEEDSLDSRLNCSSGSTRSLTQRESNSDSSLSSGSRKSINEIDFSVYAVPETQLLNNTFKRHRNVPLRTIRENDLE